MADNSQKDSRSKKAPQKRADKKAASGSMQDEAAAEERRAAGKKVTAKEEAKDPEASDPSNDPDDSFQVVTRKKRKSKDLPGISFGSTNPDKTDLTRPVAKSFASNKPIIHGNVPKQTSSKRTTHPRAPSPAAARMTPKLVLSLPAQAPSTSQVKEGTDKGPGNIPSESSAEKSARKCPWAKIPQKPEKVEVSWPVTPAPSSQSSTSAWGETSKSTNVEGNVGVTSPTKHEREQFPSGEIQSRRKSRQLVEALKPHITEAPSVELVHSPTVEQVTKALQHVEIPEKLIPLPQRKHGKNATAHNRSHVLKVMTIEVNYLPLKIKNPQLLIYHYDVAFLPDKPIFLLRSALEKMRQKYFKNRYPAFDGRKNMYVAGKPLKFPRGDTLRDTVEVSIEENGQNKSFDIAIKCVNENLNMNELIKYTETGITGEIPQSVIQATDIALRCGLSSSFTTVGRSFFADPRALEATKIQDLSGGMEMWPGIYQSAVMAWKPYVNVDVANKAFPKQQTILEYMEETLQCRQDDLCNGLRPQVKEKLLSFLKGLKIEYRMPSSNPDEIIKRNYKIVGLGRDAYNERFQPDGDTPPIVVYDYYKNAKNYEITYPKLPLLIVGSKGALVPIERCSIVSNQVLQRKLDEKQTSNMVRAAARPTNERKMTIIKNICHARYSKNPTLKEFEIEVGTDFEKVTGIVLKPPEIAYSKTTAQVRDGVWKMDTKDQFSCGSKLRVWGILTLDARMDQSKVTQLAKLLIQEGPKKGIEFQPPSRIESLQSRVSEDIIYNKLTDFGKAGCTMVLVIMTSQAECYGMVKRASELRSGVLTQCLKIKTVDLASGVRMSTVHNILLKMNAKLRGINHHIPTAIRPEVLKGAVMIVGADVTHPASDSRANTPSIAAVAASHDSTGFQYNMMYRLQHSKQEMIEDLADIMRAQIESYKRHTGNIPSKILFFRDGVSEGQFQTVLYVELSAIKRGCAMAAPSSSIGITLIVVQKRHHTRFFPHQKDGDGRNNNVPAGTLVDTVITHPTEIDFYLVSHQSIQGTARPTKYHLLWDENDIPEFELQRVTFYLCHLFSRCTRAVSYPAPTYYAHLAAFRARAWWDREDINMKILKEEQANKGRINPEILDKHPMFFV